MRKRCARCGGRDLFVGWFKMKDRCPTCGYRFERAEAFFFGAYMVNFAITEGLMLVLTVVPCIVLLARNPDADIRPVVVAGLIAAIVGPVLFYPFSKTIWTAVDTIMGPSGVPERPDPD